MSPGNPLLQVKMSKVKVTEHKNSARLDFCTLASAGFMQFVDVPTISRKKWCRTQLRWHYL